FLAMTPRPLLVYSFLVRPIFLGRHTTMRPRCNARVAVGPTQPNVVSGTRRCVAGDCALKKRVLPSHALTSILPVLESDLRLPPVFRGIADCEGGGHGERKNCPNDETHCQAACRWGLRPN